MAWGLPAKGLDVPFTGNLSEQAAKTFTDVNELQPGDAINRQGVEKSKAHVVLFVRWLNASKTRFEAYDQIGVGPKKARKVELTLARVSNVWKITDPTGNISNLGHWEFLRPKR